jgi:hypothetical protein
MNVRDASKGPWLDSKDVQAFLVFCSKKGYATRGHTNVWIDAHQVKFQGHWMSITFNKNYKRYTADKRLSLVVQSFLTEK